MIITSDPNLSRKIAVSLQATALVLELLDEIASLRTRLWAMGGEL